MILKITTNRRCQGLIALLVLGACSAPGPAPDGGTGGSPLRSELLQAVASCVTAEAAGFATEAGNLSTAAAGWAAGSTALPEVQAAFGRAMDRWQELEVVQVGPAAPASRPGGQDLRDQIYSWPLASRCAVDEVLTTGAYQAGVGALLVNRKGLDALEYLLFSPSDDVVCGNAAAWAALSGEQRLARRQAYAAALAAEVKRLSDELSAAWSGSFATTLATAGPGNATFPTTQAALNAVSDALFYAEAGMRDLKVARPAGIMECPVAPCLDQLESRYAARNTANLRANQRMLRRVLLGCQGGFSGPGFDDLLAGVGQESVAQVLRQRLDGVDAALDAIEEPDLEAALLADPPSVQALFDALKGVTDFLKTDFVTLLDLDLPMGLEGDND